MVQSNDMAQGLLPAHLEALKAIAVALMAEADEGATAKSPLWYRTVRESLAVAKNAYELAALVPERVRYKLENYAEIWAPELQQGWTEGAPQEPAELRSSDEGPGVTVASEDRGAAAPAGDQAPEIRSSDEGPGGTGASEDRGAAAPAATSGSAGIPATPQPQRRQKKAKRGSPDVG